MESSLLGMVLKMISGTVTSFYLCGRIRKFHGGGGRGHRTCRNSLCVGHGAEVVLQVQKRLREYGGRFSSHTERALPEVPPAMAGLLDHVCVCMHVHAHSYMLKGSI